MTQHALVMFSGGYTSFNSSPVVWRSFVLFLGLTQIQSMDFVHKIVPLVSMATKKLSLCKASTKFSSTWSIGSPPVSTTNGNCFESFGHKDFMAVVNSLTLSNFPPLIPLVPTKSVSQKLQIACLLSSSLPDQRLQPANRQKTAGRPE